MDIKYQIQVIGRKDIYNTEYGRYGDALGPNKVLGILGYEIFPSIFVASLMPSVVKKINS